MTVTRAEFDRLLPAAVGAVMYRCDGDAYCYGEGQRCWRITLRALPDLNIALLHLQRLEVVLHMDGYSDAERESFLRRFHLFFRRGGG